MGDRRASAPQFPEGGASAEIRDLLRRVQAGEETPEMATAAIARWIVIAVDAITAKYVKKAIGAGLALESAYQDAQRRFHNYQEWGDEEHDAIDAARTALCAVAEEAKHHV